MDTISRRALKILEGIDGRVTGYFVNATPPTIFTRFFLKLRRCLFHGLMMCMRFGCNHQINICHFFRSLNFDSTFCVSPVKVRR